MGCETVQKAGGSWRSESVEFDELTDQLVEYGMMSSDKASHNTGGFRISNKDACCQSTTQGEECSKN